MSREKQVEEMAKDLCGSTMCDLETYNRCRMSRGNCSRCQRVAEDLYNAGYRKQIKAEWKSGNKNGQYGYYCTNCDACFTGENAEWIAKEHIYCPKCGAKMKGGAE